jgi:phage shock protein A
MDTLESQLEAMDLGRDVAPDLAAQINALEEDERISSELERLKAELGDGAGKGGHSGESDKAGS